MKRSILLVSLILLMKGAVLADPADLIGTWEAARRTQSGTPFVSVFQFRDDGFYIQNDYFDGRLECIFIAAYSADDLIYNVDFSQSLFWRLNEDTGEFETFDTPGAGVLPVGYVISGDELIIIAFDVVATRSKRPLVVPAGVHTLPDGRTAVRSQSWGQIKSTHAVR